MDKILFCTLYTTIKPGSLLGEITEHYEVITGTILEYYYSHMAKISLTVGLVFYHMADWAARKVENDGKAE